MSFSFFFRLLIGSLFAIILSMPVFAQDNQWPKPEQWVGKKPSEIIHTSGSQDDEGFNFYELLTNMGGRSGAIWSVNLDDFDVSKTEQPIQRMGEYLILLAYDCGDKVCQNGLALIYNLDTEQQIVCVQKRMRERREDLAPEDIEDMDEEDTYRYQDVLEFITTSQSRIQDPVPAVLTKTGYPLSCGGSEKDALNYQSVLKHLLLMEQALHFGGVE